MKKLKLSTAISTICLGSVGFAATAVAGNSGPPSFDFECNTSDDTFCIGPDLYEVSLNCENFVRDDLGGINFNEYDGHASFSLNVIDEYEWEYDGDTVCKMSGDLDSTKTEVKCTEADKGPNKHTGEGEADHTTGDRQVEAEMKLVQADAFECGT
jgi:hypothetical protein